jgi:putative exosortase-associated protein (TIGR04073 family)
MRIAKRAIMVAAMVAVGIWMQTVNAQEKAGEAEDVVGKMGVKFCRGICNAGTGWGEVFRQIARSAENDGPFLMLPLGISRGIFMTVVRTTTGVIETAFFYVPFNNSYDCFLDPAYVWQAAKGDNGEKTK